jgi:hypothetical protein
MVLMKVDEVQPRTKYIRIAVSAADIFTANIKNWIHLCKQYYLLNLATTKIPTLPATSLPILGLLLYPSY